MKNIPTIDKMLDTIETAALDLFTEVDTRQNERAVLLDGRELGQNLSINWVDDNLVTYITPAANAIIAIYWDCNEQHEQKKKVYYYNDFSSFESLLCKMMIDMVE